MVNLYNFLLAASPVLAAYSSSSAETTGDRVISLGPGQYNGTSNVEFITTSLGQADFFKVDPAPNATTFDSWYFDAMNPSTKEVITFNYEIGYGDLYRMSLRGSWANGSIYEYEIETTHVNITEGADKSVKVHFFGGGNEFGWTSSSQLLPRPSFTATVNAPEFGISGSMIFNGSLAPPHYSCGYDQAGVDELNIDGVAWANALPDSNVTVSVSIQNVTTAYEGYGYHDKTWVSRPFQNSLQSAFWGHARLGPYAVVWWHSRSQTGVDVSAEYLAEWGTGKVLTSRCVYDYPNNTLGWGEGQIWPLVVGTPPPAGMILNWDLGDLGQFTANITSENFFVDIPFWQGGKGSITGGFVGGETYTQETGLWTLNQLEQI